MRQNLAWAFGYNAIAVVLEATGALTPLVAALAMLASSAAVVLNARRLQAIVRDEAAADGEMLMTVLQERAVTP